MEQPRLPKKGARPDSLHEDDSRTRVSVAHTHSNLFLDTFIFNVTGDVFASASAVTIDLGHGQATNFNSVELNGQPLMLTQTSGGDLETFYSPIPLSLTGPLVLCVDGSSDAGQGIRATYAGTLNVSAASGTSGTGLDVRRMPVSHR